jgi:cytochrome P450
MNPMTALMDFFPILRYLPDAVNPVARKSKALFKATTSLYLSHWMPFKQQDVNVEARFTFCKDQMETQRREGFSDEQAAWNAGSMLQAGSDTTSSTLVAFVQALATFPDVQRKAQEEIDKVIGKHRLPLMEDERHLPYLWACRKELLRWMPAGILGALPHSCTKDDEYMGYTIPRGASIVNNVW